MIVHLSVCHDGDLGLVHDAALERERLSGCTLSESAMAGRHCGVGDDESGRGRFARSSWRSRLATKWRRSRGKELVFEVEDLIEESLEHKNQILSHMGRGLFALLTPVDIVGHNVRDAKQERLQDIAEEGRSAWARRSRSRRARWAALAATTATKASMLCSSFVDRDGVL